MDADLGEFRTIIEILANPPKGTSVPDPNTHREAFCRYMQKRAQLALRRVPLAPEQDVKELIADVERQIPYSKAVMAGEPLRPLEVKNVLVSVALLNRVLAALRARSPRGGEHGA